MPLPLTPGTGSTGEHSPGGSSVVNLFLANPDDRPTVIGARLPAPIAALVVGQKLGHFELLETIGRGGMATVHKARDLELDRIVALKILPPETVNDAESVSRFKQEARAAALLNHDHIARVYYCGEDQGLHFIAFEFVAGDNLRTIMDRDGLLGAATAVQYLLHVASGLKHAAERGVVHRDIKPSNILITHEGQAKIVDMGLARQLETGGVTQSGVTLGTFDYISPEQALDPRRADVRSDIYSLGCTFYHALTGKPPVPEGTAAKKLQAHQQENPVDPRDLNPAVPEALAAVLARMMAKNPGHRYQAADDLIRDLQAAAAPCGYVLEKPLLEETSSRPIPALAKPSPGLPVAWLVAGTAAVVLLALLFGRSDSQGPTTPPWGDTVASNKAPPPDTPLSATTATSDPLRLVSSTPQLVDALKSTGATTIRLRPSTTYDLSQIQEGMIFTGASLTIESEAGGVPPLLWLNASSQTDENQPGPGMLLLKNCKQVTFKGLKIRVRCDPERNGIDDPSGIICRNIERISILGCQFDGESESEAYSALVLDSETAAELTVKNSIFNLGSRAVACRFKGPVRSDFVETAFASHEAAIACHSPGSASELNFSHCTFLLDRGTAIEAQGEVSITAGYCLFANAEKVQDEPNMPGTESKPNRAVVLHTADSNDVQFRGVENQPNGYFHVTPAVHGNQAVTVSDLPSPYFQDASARVLTRFPWDVADPRPLLKSTDPAGAFRLSLNDARLRLPPASAAVILGAKSLGSSESRIYPGAWPPERPQPVRAASNERIVWLEADADDLAYRLYPNFAAAYAALQPGEILTLAVNGPVPVPLLGEKSLRATLRAAEGYKPILVADGPSFTTDAMLFRLAEGSVTFENLEIRLKDRQAIASVAGRTTCSFHHCILTLTETHDNPGAAVVIPDASREMKVAGVIDEPPRIHFKDTVIRGTGRAVWVQTARAFEVSLENTAIAIDGTLVKLDAVEKTNTVDAPRGQMRLKNSTIVLDDALVDISAGRTNGGNPVFLAMEIENTLFTSADGRSNATPLIRLDDTEPMTDVSKFLAWNGRGAVYSYAEGAAAVEMKPGSESWDWPQWLRFARDDGKYMPRIRFARGSLKGKFASAEPADFTLSAANPLEAGASIARLLNKTESGSAERD